MIACMPSLQFFVGLRLAIISKGRRCREVQAPDNDRRTLRPMFQTARASDGSSTFSQAAAGRLCSRVETGCPIAQKLWLSAHEHRNFCYRLPTVTGFFRLPVF